MDLDAFSDLCRSRGLFLVENCCHALGARYRGRTVGSTGRAGFVALSRKHLSVCGTGGVAFTDDERLAAKMRMLGIHGREDYESEESHLIGYNMRFNEIQACIACYQLDMVDEWIAARQANAARYTHLLSRPGIPVELLGASRRQWRPPKRVNGS